MPPKQINDPDDKKPDDWDEREYIDDPEAKKPDDWDENAPREIEDEETVMPDDWLENEEALIPDPNAKKPDDWVNIWKNAIIGFFRMTKWTENGNLTRSRIQNAKMLAAVANGSVQ